MSISVTITYQGQDYTAPNWPQYFFVLPQEDGRIVFHFGVVGDLPHDQDPSQPFVMGGYHTKVLKDGAAIFDADIPQHFWNSRWTYYPTVTGPQPIRTPAEIVAARRSFPYGDTGCPVPPQPSTPPYTYMGSSNITIYMPTTGERQDIGLLTDNSGYYMLGQSPSGMMAWGFCGNTCPMHYRDQATGKPVDLLKYPTANAYDQPGKQGQPWLAKGQLNPKNGYTEYGGGWEPQQAHYCEMSYLAYQATLNPSFLEDLQYSANFTVLCNAFTSVSQGKPTIAGEYRGVAWAFRNLFMAHAATQDAEANGTLPASCLPSSYWKALLDIQLAYYTANFMENPANQYFRLACMVSGMFGPWQCDYMHTVLAFGVLTGHSDWTPFYIWSLKNLIDRLSGKSSYPPGYGTAYYLQTTTGDWWEALKAGSPPDQPPLTPEQIATLTADPLNSGNAMAGNEYMMTTRAAIVMADYLDKQGLAPVRATYPEFNDALANAERMFKNYGRVNPRVSVISQGGIMPAQITLNVGQSVPIHLTYTGGAETAIPTFTLSNDIGTISNETIDGATFTATTAGQATITVTAQGASGPITDTGEVTVNNPLPTAVSLSFGTPS